MACMAATISEAAIMPPAKTAIGHQKTPNGSQIAPKSSSTMTAKCHSSVLGAIAQWDGPGW